MFDTAKNPFEYQKPSDQNIYNITNVRDACKQLHEVLQANVPQGYYLDLAITKLEETSMWANKAIVFDD